MTMDDRMTQMIKRLMERTDKGELQWEGDGGSGYKCTWNGSRFRLKLGRRGFEFQVNDEDMGEHKTLGDLWELVTYEEDRRSQENQKRALEKALDDLSAS